MDINKVKEFVKSKLNNESSGHDYLHALRVYENAKGLLYDGLDENVVLISSLIHDLIDHKLEEKFKTTEEELQSFLSTLSLTENQIKHIEHIIHNISFSKGKTPESLEGKIVQDADRLDALGAIGIARTFSYGGKNGRLIYGEGTDGDDSVAHFYQKLFTLSSLMNTEQGKQEAIKRTTFMKEFINQLYKEIGGKQ